MRAFPNIEKNILEKVCSIVEKNIAEKMCENRREGVLYGVCVSIDDVLERVGRKVGKRVLEGVG